jgi:hypothetical protein
MFTDAGFLFVKKRMKAECKILKKKKSKKTKHVKNVRSPT